MGQDRYLELLEKFKSLRVMAVGDIYLDEVVYGKVTEVSLEAPIPVYEVHRKRHNPGAAGNAACNAASLGATVFMVGVVGADVNAGIVKHEFEARNVNTDYLVSDPARPTNTYGKLRAGGHNTPTQEILRTDTPKPVMIAGDVEAQVVAKIEALAPSVDAIMIGDQVSATLSEKVLETIVACAEKHGLKTLADSRKRAGIFKGIDVVVPNDAEAGLAAGIEVKGDADLEVAGRHLLKTEKNAMITLGPQGIGIFSPGKPMVKVPIQPVQVVDVTGAGDTVAAAVILTLAAGGSLEEAAFLGNTAAGIAVAQEGVVTVSNAEVVQAIVSGGAPAKLKNLPQLKRIIESLKREGKKIVWTNGCFDIIHVGHISYLMRAGELGDILLVGLNSDQSVHSNKGPSRPVNHELDRAVILSAFECVDYIVLFDDKTPMRLLEELQPDIYAKGGDYTIDTIVQEERQLVEGYGGSIAIIPGVEGQSTTNIVEKLQQEML